MQYHVGQRVRLKAESPRYHLHKDAEMTVMKAVSGTHLLLVKVKDGGAIWVKDEDVEVVETAHQEQKGEPST